MKTIRINTYSGELVLIDDDTDRLCVMLNKDVLFDATYSSEGIMYFNKEVDNMCELADIICELIEELGDKGYGQQETPKTT